MFVQIFGIYAAFWTCLCRIKAPPAHVFDVDPSLSPILRKSLLSPDQAEAIELDLCKSVQKLHDFSTNMVAELGSLSLGTKMAMKIFVKRVFTIFATNASFLRVIANLQI